MFQNRFFKTLAVCVSADLKRDGENAYRRLFVFGKNAEPAVQLFAHIFGELFVSADGKKPFCAEVLLFETLYHLWKGRRVLADGDARLFG